MKIADGIYYVGVDDKDIDLFEGQFVVPEGMAYNSYVIADQKIAIMDTVDAKFGDEWLAKVKGVLGGKAPDYLVVHHMEPDHSANIIKIADEYPELTIVASKMAFAMMDGFYGRDFADRRMIVGEGDKLNLGKHELTFVTAPFVHWPEVVVSYDSLSKTLFSADGFGKFGALDSGDEWACEARRYYFGIVGKFGTQVQTLLKKAATLDIERICPLHGPVLADNLPYYINLYNTWSSYGAESEGVVIAYTSVYGHTESAACALAEQLKAKGCPKVVLTDLARSDMAEAVEDAFRYNKIVLATTTYNSEIFPFMRTFIEELTERNFANKTVGFIENGIWAPLAAKVMRTMLEGCKNLTFCENTVRLKGAMKPANEQEIAQLAEELIKG